MHAPDTQCAHASDQTKALDELTDESTRCGCSMDGVDDLDLSLGDFPDWKGAGPQAWGEPHPPTPSAVLPAASAVLVGRNHICAPNSPCLPPATKLAAAIASAAKICFAVLLNAPLWIMYVRKSATV